MHKAILPKIVLMISMLILLLSSVHECFSQDLLRKINKSPTTVKKFPVRPEVLKQTPAPLIDDGSAPTITDISPLVAGQGTTVTITGTSLGGTSKVTFGGIDAESFIVESQTTIKTIVGKATSGNVQITKPSYAVVSMPGFIFINTPEIKSVTPQEFVKGDEIIIEGEGFEGNLSVTIDGKLADKVTVKDKTNISVIVEEEISNREIIIETAAGRVKYVSKKVSKDADGLAEITLPNIANGSFLVVPTPSFKFSQVKNSGRIGFSANIWGNSLGTDSNMQSVANKTLISKLSVFGLEAETVYKLTGKDKDFTMGLIGQVNFLLKKISFFDTLTKNNTNFNPFVIHPKAGLSMSFYKDIFFFNIYANWLFVTTENKPFGEFFKTEDKFTFFYPEFNVGGYFDIAENQSIKVELGMIINSKDVKLINNSGNKIAPFLQIGFKSKL